MKLLYDPDAGMFYTESSYTEKDVPKAAGFIWDRLMKGKWATQDASKAERLASWADPACQEILRQQIQRKITLVQLSSATDSNVEIPHPDGLEYFGFQKAGILFATAKKRALIADEMGLGKTIQAIGVINFVPTIKKVLVITKASLRINWRNELNKWLTRKLSVELAFSGQWPYKADVIIINYDILRNHKGRIQDTKWDMLIIDEAHYVKNPAAIRTQMVFGASPKRQGGKAIAPIMAEYVVATTGSPIENRPVEIFGLLNYLDKSSWNSWWRFVNEYCDAHQTDFGWDYSGASNKEKLCKELRETVMVRRLKKDVLKDLPDMQYQVIEIPVEDSGLKKILANELAEWEKRMVRIRQLREAAQKAKISGDSAGYREQVKNLKDALGVEFREFSKRRHETGIKKVPYVLEYLKDLLEEQPHKMLIFGHHHDVLGAIHSEFKNNSVLVTGEVAPDKRQPIVDRFQIDPGLDMFIGSTGAAGVGLNITAASHVIFVEEDLVPERMAQAEARAHRIGQLEKVLVTHLVLEGSLDAKIAKIAANKGSIIDVILGYAAPDRTSVDTSGWGSKLPTEEQATEDTLGAEICPF